MLASRQSAVSSVRRDAWVEIDLTAIENNVRTIRSWIEKQHPQQGENGTAPNTVSDRAVKLMGVVKSDAYGHGAVGIAEVLTASGADWLGVASVDEGCQLRQSKIEAPILILSPAPGWAYDTALEYGLDLTITSSSQIRDIARVAMRHNQRARVHLKVDTGMHRIGASASDVVELLEEIERTKNLELIGIFSHLAKADEMEFTTEQSNRFKEVLDKLDELGKRPQLVHLASGDAARRFPFTHFDMVRVGLYLYGLEPRAVSDVVTPAMSIRARINHVSHIPQGESAGYNCTWTATRPSRLASIPIGYADGVDRRLSNQLRALVMGKEVRQVGMISMDQMLFDITDVTEAQEGDVVTLIGCEHPSIRNAPHLYLSEWAQKLDTITYELACRMRVRLPRVYTRQRTSSTQMAPKAASPKQCEEAT